MLGQVHSRAQILQLAQRGGYRLLFPALVEMDIDVAIDVLDKNIFVS